MPAPKNAGVTVGPNQTLGRPYLGRVIRTFDVPSVIVQRDDAGEADAVERPSNVPVKELFLTHESPTAGGEKLGSETLTTPGAYVLTTLYTKTATNAYSSASDFLRATVAPVRLLWSALIVTAVAAGVGNVNFCFTM